MGNKNALFVDHPFIRSKIVKYGFYLLFICEVFFLITFIIALFDGLISNHLYSLIGSSIIFVMMMVLIPYLLILKNNRLYIYHHRIVYYTMLNRKKVFFINPQECTIHISYTSLNRRGIKYSFYNSDNKLITHNVYLEPLQKQDKIRKQREIIYEDFTNIGFTIIDPKGVLLKRE